MDVLVAWIEQSRAGDIASVLGLLVALVGFAITIWNVRASKAAAIRAEEAANEARRAIRFFDVVRRDFDGDRGDGRDPTGFIEMPLGQFCPIDTMPSGRA